MSNRTIALSEAVADTSLGQAAHPGGLSPARMPHIRDQVARFIANPHGPLAENFPEHRAGFDLVVSHLSAAEMYWVTPDMSALAVSAGSQLETIRWTDADRPAGCGLIVFAGGIGMAQVAGAALPIDAMTWGPMRDGVSITTFCGRWRLRHEALETHLLPPLLVAKQDDIGGGGGEVSVTELPERSRTLLSALAAAWSLMDQPTIASRTESPVNRKLARSYRRSGRPLPGVSIIDLRTIYRPTQDDDQGNGRTYRHRWVVRGHWRDQAHGPGRELRKRIYVPSYIKGPDGAPLLAKEHVNVWRR